MSPLAPISIEAVVDDAERPAFLAAAEQLDECSNTGSPDRREIRLRLVPSWESIDASDPTTVVIASMLPELARDEPLSSIENRWRERLSSPPATSTFLCTIFRHVPRAAAGEHPDARAASIERIGRLNLLAAQLSHDTGVGVIDVDRALAHLGARTLQTDYRLSGTVGAEVAAHTIVLALLSTGLDDALAPESLQRAAQFHGALWQVGGLLTRRLGQRR